MSGASSPRAPQPGRLPGIDLARAVALFGMVVFNFQWMLEPEQTSVALEFVGDHLAGRFAALFVLLTGISISLAHRRSSTSSLRRRLLIRAVALGVLGVSVGSLWPNDILHFYAFYLLIAVAVLDAPSRSILATAGIVVLTSVALHVVLDHNVGWDWDDEAAYSALFVPHTFLRHLLFNGLHPILPWAAFMLVGMVVGRLDLSSWRVQAWLGSIGLWACALGEGLAMALDRWLDPILSPHWLVEMGTTYAWPPMLPFVLSGFGCALVIVASCGWLCERAPAESLAPLQAMGRAALSLYVFHAVAGVLLLARSGWFPIASYGDVIACSALFLGPAMLVSTLWDRRRGPPLERMLRALTSWTPIRSGRDPSRGLGRIPVG